MVVNFKVKWDKNALSKLNKCADVITYEVARRTLDKTFIHIPMGETGNLRKSSMAKGVRGSNANYHIGSYTDYAIDVWNYNDNATNWTTPDTYSHWYEQMWEKEGKMIIKNAIERNIE